MTTHLGFIPKLIQLAHVVGEDERAKSLRSTGLQALSAMVWFTGQHCYISAEFDNIVSVVLENYCCLKKASENPDWTKKRWVQEVLKNEGLGSASPDAFPRAPSWKKIVNDEEAFNVTLKDGQNPQFWSRVCLHDMARLAKEATTARRMLESLFRHFDDADLWSLQHGIAFPVLKEMQILMDSSAALFEKIWKGKGHLTSEEEPKDKNGILNRLKSSYSRVHYYGVVRR